jgi:RimJ/RimL family protein N-acetyltransferase
MPGSSPRSKTPSSARRTSRTSMVLRTARLLLRAVDSGDSALYESLRKDEFSGTFFAVRNHKPRSFEEIQALSGSNALFYGTICYLKSGLPHGFFLVEKNPSYTLLSFLAPKDRQGHGYCKEALSALSESQFSTAGPTARCCC